MKVRRRGLPGESAKPAKPGRTDYRVAIERKLSVSGKKSVPVSLLTLQLITGRTHQIRSHLQQVKHPLAGDRRYGDKDFNRVLAERYGLRRQFLHAYRLNLVHPVTGRKHNWTDGYPEDLAGLAKSLRLGIPS
jgi:23S rRNA pseudouridine955/2504/2580 synthase